MRNRRSVFAFGLLLLTAGAGQSQQLFSNFPVSGQISAFQVNAGYSVSNSFTLTAGATISEVSFGAWVKTGDSVAGVAWSIGAVPYGVSLGSGVAGATSLYDMSNADGYDVDTVSFAIPGLTLPAGTYYLTLSSAVSAGGNPVYWDINDGPGIDASDSSYGHVSAPPTCFNVVGISGTCASSFQLLSANTNVTPAPTSLTFPTQSVNTTSSPQVITITNNGPGAATLTGIAVTGANFGDFAQTNNCPISPATLAVNGVCTISVTFTPLGTVNPRAGAITVTGSSPLSVGLSGTGFTQYLLTTSVNPAGAGAISPASGLFNSNSVVTVSATANPGYQFSGFSGALTGSSPQNLAMTGPASVTANFVGWYGAGGTWNDRKTITISHAQVGATLAGFPVLVSITDANLQTGAKVDGSDILFTAADGLTRLNHEVDQYNSATGQLVAWINVPSLSSTADTTLYMYYSNPSATTQQNAAGVWSSYAAVYHLPNGASLTTSDSTANANNMAAAGTPGPVAAAGQIGGGVSWNGSTQMGLDAAHNPTLDPGNNSLTASIWLKTSSKNGLDVLNYWFYPGAGWRVFFGNDGKAAFRTTDGTNSANSPESGVVNNGAWHYIAGVLDRTGGSVDLYVDGALAGSTLIGAVGSLANTSAALNIAQNYLKQINSDAISLDEARYLVGTALSASWINTEYKNQSAPATFYSVGSQQVNSGTTDAVTVDSSPTGLALTVDGSACTAPCSFQWVVGSNHTISAANQAGAAGTQYVFAGWSDSGAASHIVTVPSTPVTYTASFTTQYFLTTAINPAGAGTISPVSGWFDAASMVMVSATANSGFQFSGFSGSLTGSSPQNLTMNGPSSVTANFIVPWYGTGGIWSNRKTITISHAQVAATLTGFPVLVSVTDGNLQTGAKADGSDILFTAADGLTRLNHEVDQYNSATGQLVAWVNIPSLSSTADTTVYMYYGNASAASQQNAAGVWSSYVAVYHLPNGTTLTTGDSTANANNMAASGTPGPGAAAGEIGGAASWNGSTQTGLDAVHNPTIDPGNNSLTASIWLKTNSRNGLDVFNYWFYPGAGWRIFFGNDGKAAFRTTDGTNSANSPESGVLNNGAWHYIAGVLDRTGGKSMLYVDGVLAGSTPVGAMGSLADTSAALNMSQSYLKQLTSDAIALDEARYLIGTALSASWISTEYKNQSAPATFYSVGPQQNHP